MPPTVKHINNLRPSWHPFDQTLLAKALGKHLGSLDAPASKLSGAKPPAQAGQKKEWARTLGYVGLDPAGQRLLKFGQLTDGRYAVSTAGTDDVKGAPQTVREKVASSGAGQRGRIYLVPPAVIERALAAGQVVKPTTEELLANPNALPRLSDLRAFADTIKIWARGEWGKGINGEAIPKADKGNPVQQFGNGAVGALRDIWQAGNANFRQAGDGFNTAGKNLAELGKVATGKQSWHQARQNINRNNQKLQQRQGVEGQLVEGAQGSRTLAERQGGVVVNKTLDSLASAGTTVVGGVKKKSPGGPTEAIQLTEGLDGVYRRQTQPTGKAIASKTKPSNNAGKGGPIIKGSISPQRQTTDPVIPKDSTKLVNGAVSGDGKVQVQSVADLFHVNAQQLQKTLDRLDPSRLPKDPNELRALSLVLKVNQFLSPHGLFTTEALPLIYKGGPIRAFEYNTKGYNTHAGMEAADALYTRLAATLARHAPECLFVKAGTKVLVLMPAGASARENLETQRRLDAAEADFKQRPLALQQPSGEVLYVPRPMLRSATVEPVNTSSPGAILGELNKALDKVKAAQAARGELLGRGSLDPGTQLYPANTAPPEVMALLQAPASNLAEFSPLHRGANLKAAAQLFDHLKTWAARVPEANLGLVSTRLIRASTIEPMTGLDRRATAERKSGQPPARAVFDLRHVGNVMKVTGGPKLIDQAFEEIGRVAREAKTSLEKDNPALKNIEIILSRDPYSDEIFVGVRAANRTGAQADGTGPAKRAQPLTQEQATAALQLVRAEMGKRIADIQLKRDVLVSRLELVPGGYRVTTHTERVTYRPVTASAVAESLTAATEGLEAEKAVAKAHEAANLARNPNAPPPGVTVETVPGSQRVQFRADPRASYGAGPTQPVLLKITRQEQ